MDVDLVLRYLTLVKRISLSSDIVIAGGINPSNMGMLKPILEKFPNTGIDAETGLRNQKDYLDISKVRQYLDSFSAMT
jgi:phosphoribosylanthranilate isomerase